MKLLVVSWVQVFTTFLLARFCADDSKMIYATFECFHLTPLKPTSAQRRVFVRQGDPCVVTGTIVMRGAEVCAVKMTSSPLRRAQDRRDRKCPVLILFHLQSHLTVTPEYTS